MVHLKFKYKVKACLRKSPGQVKGFLVVAVNGRSRNFETGMAEYNV